MGVEARSRWAEAGRWTDDVLRREVFFFRSQGVYLYGSLAAAVELTRPFGLLCCGSWGVEADRSDPLVRSVGLEMARMGGATMTFHYPGYGDSFGSSADLQLADLVQAALDAGAEAARRCPGVSWNVAGFMLGASVASLAQRPTPGGSLLLVQPALRPGAYFRWLSETSQLLAPGPAPKAMMEAGTTPGMAYGYPIPAPIVDQAEGADAAVAAALADFEGDGAVIRHEVSRGPDPGAMPEGFDRIDVPGTWRFGTQNHPGLARATARWLERNTGSGGTR